jgi:hypothetical protein
MLPPPLPPASQTNPRPRSVKLISGSLSHENGGNQLGHASAVCTLLLTALTAVAQIVCLNRGLRAYDSTLCVPVFYGVYTAAGFLDALVFTDAVGAYRPWTLFAIFCAICVLVAGVVTLTHKKPAAPAAGAGGGVGPAPRRPKRAKAVDGGEDEDDEAHALHTVDLEAGGAAHPAWALGDDEDDEDEHAPVPAPRLERPRGEEGAALMAADEPPHAQTHAHARADSTESDATLAARAADDADEFGEWKDADAAAHS